MNSQNDYLPGVRLAFEEGLSPFDVHTNADNEISLSETPSFNSTSSDQVTDSLLVIIVLLGAILGAHIIRSLRR